MDDRTVDTKERIPTPAQCDLLATLDKENIVVRYSVWLDAFNVSDGASRYVYGLRRRTFDICVKNGWLAKVPMPDSVQETGVRGGSFFGITDAGREARHHGR